MFYNVRKRIRLTDYEGYIKFIRLEHISPTVAVVS